MDVLYNALLSFDNSNVYIFRNLSVKMFFMNEFVQRLLITPWFGMKLVNN